MARLCVSDAFYEQLKSLCITDFPCGTGSWKNQTLDIKDYSSRFVSGGAEYESTEDILELERSAPYAVDCSWSKEAKSLRKIAVESPEYLNDPNYVLKHFTTLRIANKNVYTIDEGLLKFVNLKELFLGANFITELSGKNIPKSLEVLELVGNNIETLFGLKGSNLTSLLHLGLAYNKVYEIVPEALFPNKWPSLLSLDLSYNNLNYLQTTVEIIKELPCVRNLMLIGNPLYLSKSYHAYIIDSIPKLSFLDNTEVSAEDKHKFNCFSKIKDINVNTGEFEVEIISLSGVKKPAEPEETEAVSDYPKIEFKYHVEFQFLNDRTEQDGDGSNTQEGQEDPSTNSNTMDTLPENVIYQFVSTDKLLWADGLDFNFSKTFNVSELVCLRSFLETGVQFNIVSVKHSYVLEDPQLVGEAEATNGHPANNGENVAEKSASKDRCKNDKDKGKPTAKKASLRDDKEKPGKKDKRAPADLFELPQERKIAGSYHVTFGTFLDNDGIVGGSYCCKEGEENDGNQTNEKLRDGTASTQNDNKRGDILDKKKSKEVDKTLKVAPSKSKGLKSATNLGKAAKTGKGKDKIDEVNETDESEALPPPPPLSIKFQVRLNRWNNTKDVLENTKQPNISQNNAAFCLV